MDSSKPMSSNRRSIEDVVPKKLRDKQFLTQNSPLTDLYENVHIRTVYHIFIAIFIGLLVNITVYNYAKFGRIEFGLTVILPGFGNLHLAILLLSLLYVGTFLCYYCFNIWATKVLNSSKVDLKMWNRFWLSLIPIYYGLSFYLTTLLVDYLELAPGSIGIVVMEQTRLLMKIHAFIRENAKKVTNYKPHTDSDLKLASFSHFLYFLFAPTLIYRDQYPRTKSIRWRFVMGCALETIVACLYLTYVLQWFLYPTIANVGEQPYTLTDLLLIIVQNTITGILLMLINFYVILHSTQNLFAELLRFGDRLFYKHWWTVSTYSEYYRTWNVVVHDWLYTYIYKDVFELWCRWRTGANSIAEANLLAKLTVFFVSAVVHEWILVCVLHFFFPVLMFQFLTFGTLLTFVRVAKTSALNVLFWYSLALGSGISISLYGLEFMARLKNTEQTHAIFDVPLIFTSQYLQI